MRNLPLAYLNAAKAAGRYPNIYAIIYGTNINLTLSGKDAIISANIVNGDTAKPAYFEVGRAISSSATITVDRRRIQDETNIVSGAKMEIYAEFDNPDGTAISAFILSTMYISGYDSQDKDIGYIYAVDRFVYAGGDFNPDNLTYPVSCSALISAAFAQAGFGTVTMSLPCDPNVNSAPYKSDEPVADGMSGDPYICRDVIAKIAGMQMSDIFLDAAGNPKLYAYGNYITGAVTDDMILEARVGSEVFQIYQVLVYHTDERMPKDEQHYQRLPYSPRFEDMDEVGSGSAWWDDIVDRANDIVRKDWLTASVTIAGVGEIELGDFVKCGSDQIPLFISGIVYNFSNAHFTETLYSFAYTLEEYYQAPAKATVVKTDNTTPKGSGVGEYVNDDKNSERFNDYEGNETAGTYDHIEGKNNKSTAVNNPEYGTNNHMEGENNRIGTASTVCHAEGANNRIGQTGHCYCVHVEGQGNTVDNSIKTFVAGDGHTVNNCTQTVIAGGYGITAANCYSSLLSGQSNNCTGASFSIVGGQINNVHNVENIVGGFGNTVNGRDNIVGGQNNNAGYSYSAIVGGYSNTVLGDVEAFILAGEDNTVGTGAHRSLTIGHSLTNVKTDCIMCGNNGSNAELDAPRLVVANTGIKFYVDYEGAVYAAGGYHAIGADYAEYFEWADGNSGNEDRRGTLVSLEGDRIVPAHGDDILGAVSVRPSVVGNAYEEHWHGKYRTDAFGDYILDENGEKIISDDFDPDRKYIPRSKRPEWAAVGIVGCVIVTDDGRCTPGGNVSARHGIAVPTFSRTNVRCLRRVDDTHIEVLIK